MGVYIKDMEMPTSCYACMFFAQTDYWNKEGEADILSHCKRTGEKTWESVNGYLPNCPLVPVPLHGDLIDKGGVEVLWWTEDPEKDFEDGVLFVLDKLDELPVIIPAEEGET